MDKSQKEKLNEMIDEFKTVDSTMEIRNAMKSTKIRKEVNVLRQFIGSNAGKHVCTQRCPLLSSKYTHIFEGIVNKTIDFDILYSILNTLKQIENGELDQHEASFQVGTLLKETYVNEKLNIPTKEKPSSEENNLSWKQFKETVKSLH